MVLKWTSLAPRAKSRKTWGRGTADRPPGSFPCWTSKLWPGERKGSCTSNNPLQRHHLLGTISTWLPPPQGIRKDHRDHPKPRAGNVNPASCHDPEQPCYVHSGQHTEIPTASKGLLWENAEYLQKIHHVRSSAKMLALGRGKHSPQLPTMSSSPGISPFFSLILFHFSHYILNIQPISLLVLGIGSANCCNFPKLHHCDKRKIQMLSLCCHLIIQIQYLPIFKFLNLPRR